jgi:hypothetical protein
MGTGNVGNTEIVPGSWWPYDGDRYERAGLEFISTGRFIDPHFAMMWVFKEKIYYKRGIHAIEGEIFSKSDFSEECKEAFNTELCRISALWEQKRRRVSASFKVPGTFIARVMQARRVEAQGNKYLTQNLPGYRLRIIPSGPNGSSHKGFKGYHLAGPDHNGIKTILLIQDPSSNFLHYVRMVTPEEITISNGVESWGLSVFGLKLQAPTIYQSQCDSIQQEYKQLVSNYVKEYKNGR